MMQRFYHTRRSIDHAFYDEVRSVLAAASEPHQSVGVGPTGVVLSAQAGDLLTMRLMDGPQVVHLFAWNPDDPDERIWPNETSGMENAFLRQDSRIWSQMARFRPLLTVVRDTVRTVDVPGAPVGRHHFVLGGFETPAAWRAAGGDPAVPSPWERFLALLDGAGIDGSLYRDHISFFQKISVEPSTQRFRNLPSDAVAGDEVTLFAEIDLRVALVPSPYLGGGIAPSDITQPPRRVTAELSGSGMEPLSWPYASVPYPDICPYTDSSGRRT